MDSAGCPHDWHLTGAGLLYVCGRCGRRSRDTIALLPEVTDANWEAFIVEGSEPEEEGG